VLEPIKVVITNYEEEVRSSESMMFEVQNSPTDVSLGSHGVEMTDVIYLDASDFRLVDDTSYYGLAPNKAVGLRYHGGKLFCEEVVTTTNSDCSTTIVELKCRFVWIPPKTGPNQIHI